MAWGPFDWNGNGKTDAFDIFMDMKIMEELDDEDEKSDDDDFDFDSDDD